MAAMSSSPTSPSLHPTSSPSPALPLPAWHFPFGPSSRYHHTERPRLNHSRTTSSYIPRAPVLSTEKRAHRRAQNRSLGSAISPPLSECGRSPLSRFPSYTPRATMATQNDAPFTPAKSPHRNPPSLQDSPFSDYFSDDARSSVHTNTVPSSETKALLLRMNKLQSQLMRDQPSTAQRRAIAIVETKLSEIESEMSGMRSHPRRPHELEDSGVFVESDEKQPVQTPSHSRGPSSQSINSSAVFSDDTPTADSYKAERDWLLLRMQELLDTLNYAQSELRQRQAEVKEWNNHHSVILEEKNTEIEKLRSENEGLRQDLGFEYSELLFLKLQMKGLECDVSELHEARDDLPPSSAAERSHREKKNRILSEMDRWRTDSDWQDVEARFKRRRSKYGIPASPIRNSSASSKAGHTDTDNGEVEWQLETQRGDLGRVTSLTIKRVGSSYGIPRTDGAGSSSDEQQLSVPLNGTTDLPARLSDEAPPSQKLWTSPLAATKDNGTQTEWNLPSPQQQNQLPYPFSPLDEDQLFPDSNSNSTTQPPFNLEDHNTDNECAVTTSSEADLGGEDLYYQDISEDEDDEDDDTVTRKPSRIDVHPPPPQNISAWKELWTSLQSLSGMGEDDEDEDG